MSRIILFNKPYDVLCQFTDAQGRRTLADYIPLKGVYAAGRLDKDSEGLLVLSDDGGIQHRISDPRYKLAKTYLVQVEGVATARALERLGSGVKLKDGMAKAQEVSLLAKAPGWLWSRQPPIRVRKNKPTSWLSIVLDEGRNRQVRRMTAAVGLPTLRLIRTGIGDWQVTEIPQGQWIEAEFPA